MTNEEIAEKICRSLGIAFEEFKAGVAVSAIKEALSAKDTQIAALRAEVERLKEIVHEQARCMRKDEIDKYQETIISLSAELEICREALEKIASMENLTFAECSDAELIVDTAKKALSLPPSELGRKVIAVVEAARIAIDTFGDDFQYEGWHKLRAAFNELDQLKGKSDEA